MSAIKVAIVGVGNCASSLVQGVRHYSAHPDAAGQMYPQIGPYRIADIEFVAAFDVDSRKVGRDLADAVFAAPNCAARFAEVPPTGVVVQRGPALDGVAPHMRDVVSVDDATGEVDVAAELRRSGADICVCYLPVGSAEAARFYARAALDAGVSFVNAIPEFICSDPAWSSRFRERGIPCAGDDIKSQLGATIVHRVLTRLAEDRGHAIDSTYQLNIGGNTDFLNMTDESRLTSKRVSKTNAVTSILGQKGFGVKIGPSDYIPHLRDNKVCYINIKGRQFGGLPFELDLKLSVEDSPNSAGVMTEVIRAVKLARDRGVAGNVNDVSAYAFKSPETQVRDDEARRRFESFIANR